MMQMIPIKNSAFGYTVRAVRWSRTVTYAERPELFELKELAMWEAPEDGNAWGNYAAELSEWATEQCDELGLRPILPPDIHCLGTEYEASGGLFGDMNDDNTLVYYIDCLVVDGIECHFALELDDGGSSMLEGGDNE